jgi:L-lactate dehydrogenase complex protein LldG
MAAGPGASGSRLMSARDEVFATIRRSLGVSGNEPIRRDIVTERLRRTPKGVIPERGQVAGRELTALFRTHAEAAFATVTEVESATDVPEAVAGFLRGHNLPSSLRMGEDPRLGAMAWERTSLDVAQGPSAGSDLNAVSHAFGGVAETGTLIMTSGPDNPSTLNFLPDNHIVILAAKDISGDYETMWDKLRATYARGHMPRTVNMITGPSRSADIEQTLLLGAHGPRRLHIVIVNG